MPDPTETLEQPDANTPADMVGIRDEDPEELTGGDAAGHRADAETTPEDGGSEAPAGPDLSWLNDDLQARVKADPEFVGTEEFWNEIQNGYKRNDSFTQGMQEKAKLERELEALAPAADKWERLISDPARARYVSEYRPAEQSPPAEVPEDLFLRSPNEILDYINKTVVEPKVAEAKAEAERYKQEAERDLAPQRHAAVLNALTTRWAEEQAVNDDDAMAAATLIGKNVDTTALAPEMLPSMLDMALAQVKQSRVLEQIQSHQTSTQRKVDAARTASPRGGVGKASPEIAPFEERAKDIADPTEYANALYDEMLRKQGLKERDMDEGLRTGT